MKHKPFFVACLCLVFWAHSIAQAAPIATVRTSRGETFIRAKGKTQAVPLTVRKSLFAGDVVGTGPGGKLALLFSDGATVRLNEKSTIEITPPQGAGKSSLFRALGGELWARLRPGNTASTRTVALGVRGTEIFLQVAEGDGTTTLTVIKGEVEFFNPFGRVVVATSQQSTARPGQAPTMPITIPNAALIIEWSLDLEQALIPREKFFTTSEALRNRRTLNDEVLTWKRQAGAQPENIETQSRYGDALFDAGQFQEALATWQRVNEKAARGPATLTRLGYAHLELDELDKAQAAFDAALQNEPNHLMALIGNAQLQLARNRPIEAQQAAERAIAVDAKNAEANIALGLALMRQPAKQMQAKAAFEVAAQGDPSLYRYQAHSWLSLLALAQGQNDIALAEGLAATNQAPFSALARGNLALAYFYSGKAREAEREARIAAQLEPDSPAARVALGQALLARGDVDAAARMAAQAVALDPQLAPAHYLLGIAGAQRRDYRHAVRDLQESLRLAPDFLPASAALARVYTRMDRKEEALTVLRIAQLRRPDNKDVLAALGEIHYEQANYAQAIDAFQQATAQAPSALAYAGLARVALDANRLDLAINAGQKAVQLAPQIAQYHAILAQAYTFSGLETQAQRELRTALALDPQNAFALAQFSAKLITGDERTTRRTQGTGFRQAFLLDPAISDQLERGGIDTQLTAQGGSRTHSGIVLHRNRAFDGQLHFYGRAESRHDDGNRANSKQRLSDAYQELTYTLNPATNLYFNAIHNEFKTGLPGPATRPVLDDRARFRFNQGIIGARHRIGRQAHLWAGYLDTVQRNDRFNPGRDNSFRATPVDSTINVPQSLRRLETVSREVRLDFPANFQPATPGLFSLGVASLRTRQQTTRLFSSSFGRREDLGILRQPALVDTDLAYLQLSQRLGRRLSLTGQARYQTQKLSINSFFTSLSPGLPVFNVPPERSIEAAFLPSLVANYQLNNKTQLRLIASKNSTFFASSIFIPVDSTTSSEEETLFLGLPRNLRTIELDAERYLAPGSFLKLFLFRSSADSTSYDLSTFSNPTTGNGVASSLVSNNVKRSGVGVRFEQRINNNLFGQVLLSANNTTGDITGVAGRGQRLPYHPRYQASIGLNYISAAGNKVGLQINRVGGFFQDRGVAAAVRPTFSPQTYVDLTLAKEPSVRSEVFLKVLNLFDQRQIAFNDVPVGQRRVVAGFTGRF